MRSRRPLVLLALALVLGLVAGCSDDGGSSQRTPGEKVTPAEADVLAELLHRNYERGGADFVLTAPYAEGTVLRITGEVDFRESTGRAQAVTTFTNGQPQESRTLFFTARDIWFGDVPGLPAALTAAGLPNVPYVRRPLATGADGGAASLLDVVVELVLRLSARTGDDPRAFLERDYTWQGQQSINGRLASLFGFGRGKSVAVSSDKLMVQYVTRLPNQDFAVTITLADHGKRQITLPADAQTLNAADHPDIAAKLGV
jgi:hypothetical protein